MAAAFLFTSWSDTGLVSFVDSNSVNSGLPSWFTEWLRTHFSFMPIWDRALGICACSQLQNALCILVEKLESYKKLFHFCHCGNLCSPVPPPSQPGFVRKERTFVFCKQALCYVSPMNSLLYRCNRSMVCGGSHNKISPHQV